MKMKIKQLMSPFNKNTISILLIFIIISSLSSITASAEADDKESMIIMLEETNEIDVQKISNKFPKIHVHLIKEINSLAVDNIETSQVSDIKDYAEKSLSIPSNNIVDDVKISVPTSKVNMSVSQLTQDPNLLNDTDVKSYGNWMWDIKQVTNNYQSYDINKGSHNIKVGIIDSGIDFNHPDLKKNIISEGKSFVPGDISTQDTLGHGTMIAGTIAANGKITGVGPDIGLVPYRVFDQNGADSSWVIEAIIQATKDDMDVINLSLSTFKSLKNKEDRNIIKAYQRAFKYARKNNTIVVASAGNDGIDISNPKKSAEQLGISDDLLLHIPGGQKDIITVSGTTKENTLASYSNYGKVISIAAPGGDYGPDWKNKQVMDINSFVLTTFPTNLPQTYLSNYLGFDQGYELMAGTSLATPKVTASVALIKDEYFKKYGKEMSNSKVEKILYKNTDKFTNYDKDLFGSGTVNVYKALINLNNK
ncbi:S8 family serine peptidase [Priestia megaterium]|uniref:S8 family serine peptidase n=1 Tax=Priestia megaterium TaxID=1404 RepID=UPI0036DE0720